MSDNLFIHVIFMYNKKILNIFKHIMYLIN